MDSIEVIEPAAIVEGAANILDDFSGTPDAGLAQRLPNARSSGTLRSTLRWSGCVLIVWSIGAALLGALLLQAKPGNFALE